MLLGLIILCLRDGHTYPGETPREALMDAIVVVLFIAASQLFGAYLTSQPALPRDVMLRGCAAGGRDRGTRTRQFLPSLRRRPVLSYVRARR